MATSASAATSRMLARLRRASGRRPSFMTTPPLDRTRGDSLDRPVGPFAMFQ